jgi:hypothetical protein
MAVRDVDAEGNLPITDEQLGLHAEAEATPMETGEGGPATEEAQKEQDREELLASLIVRIEDQDARQQEMEALISSQAQELADLRANQFRMRDMGASRLKPNDPPKFSGEDKGVVDDWTAAMRHWLAAGLVAPEHEVLLARTFLVKGAASLFAAREAELPRLTTGDGRVYIPYADFESFLKEHFGYQDQEQVARDELDELRQTGSVEDFARKFQACTAKIKSMPMSEGDLIQRFRKGLRPEILQHVAVDPSTQKRWTSLQAFIAFASTYDASRVQVNKAGQGKGSDNKMESFAAVLGKRSADSGDKGFHKKAKVPEKSAVGQANNTKVPDKYQDAFKAGLCFHCKKPGHRKVDCFAWKKEQQAAKGKGREN